jgi:hypothetical protein
MAMVLTTMERFGKFADVHPDEVENFSAAGWVTCSVQWEPPELVLIYKLTNGKRGERASKANITREEAEMWIAERPDSVYEIVSAQS